MMSNEHKEAAKELLRQELARRSFYHFCRYYDRDFVHARPFVKDICEAFQEVEDKKIKSLSVSLPPRAGKSYITSLFCAWTLGKNPDKSVMRNACTATLFLKFSYDVRAILKDERFKRVFPDVSLSDDKANLQGWNTNKSKQVGYFGAGVGGTIIGFGASNVAITDDLYRGIEDALSDTVHDRIIQWKESTHDSRFETGCARIDIGTRWSVKDIIGNGIESKIYDKSIIVSALDDQGNSFCEAVMTTDEYKQVQKRTAKEIWLAEYQQQPIDIEGRLFSDYKRINQKEFDEFISTNQVEGTLAYIDVSDTGMDYTAMAIAAIVKNQTYIVDYVFNRDNTDLTIPQCAALLNKWNVSYCRVESNNMGAMFARNLQNLTKTKILQVANTTNKITRIIMQSAFISQRMQFVVKEEQQCLTFIENMLSFSKEGKNKHDDAPDCLAGLSLFLQSMFKNLS
jgi:predicted phage terminase large subunit-like protein